VLRERDFEITAFPVQHRDSASLGYMFQELPRRPFLNEKAEALGVPAGPERRRLVQGESIALPDGRIVTPDDVLGPEMPGAKLVFVGDAGVVEDLVEPARGADLLVIEATYLEEEREMARQFGHITARQAAELARAAHVRELVLTHISRRYATHQVLDEARHVFPATRVARDFDSFSIVKNKLSVYRRYPLTQEGGKQPG